MFPEILKEEILSPLWGRYWGIGLQAICRDRSRK